ncbi:MAG: hypothetical protein AB1Z22_06125, partial [Synechococcaceae cyanobacterium]
MPAHPAAFRILVAGSHLAALALACSLPLAGTARAETCTFLKPIGGDGSSDIVSKRVDRGRLIGRPNWNTDFIVDQPY